MGNFDYNFLGEKRRLPRAPLRAGEAKPGQLAGCATDSQAAVPNFVPTTKPYRV
jgi:hypothetical protein